MLKGYLHFTRLNEVYFSHEDKETKTEERKSRQTLEQRTKDPKIFGIQDFTTTTSERPKRVSSH